MKYNYLFGPVASRRLGISLGIDMVPYKVCNMDCLYCESGKTTIKTMERKSYIPKELLMNELKHFISSHPFVDFMTFSGAGEPLLNTDFKEVSLFLKDHYPFFNTALITNGTLFYLPEVRQAVQDIDVVLPSLDAVSQEVFTRLNRPHVDLDIRQIIQGLISLRQEYDGLIWLEIFIVEGINDTDEELKGFLEVMHKIKPDKIQINSLDRPGTDKSLKTARSERLEEIKRFFHPFETEIISRKYKPTHLKFKHTEGESFILETLKRRPCTKDDLLTMSSLSEEELNQVLFSLIKEKRIITVDTGEKLFYQIADN